MRLKTFFLIYLLALGLLIQSCASAPHASLGGSLADLKPVMGNWKRIDRAYELIIKESDGKVTINYYNPSLGYIYVSQSDISMEGGKIKVGVTLSDRNYAGNKYVLTYNDKADTLQGRYDGMGVTFVREGQKP
jgi:hypothetical protein